jgi:hypothetical protein
MEIGGERLESLNRLGCRVGRYRNHVKSRTHIDTRSMLELPLGQVF